ncbi:MAG: membrane protein insertion efficiency factor YidD [Acidobacteria bacterium]|nr:membrane protein insertion efficiency factor YidD [Acidobacteriota bacterium]
MRWTSRIGVSVVHAYQLLLSPFLGGACRFEPSCSQYAISAITQHGLLRGGWFALRRIVKCHPFGPHGLDPVPGDSRSARS